MPNLPLPLLILNAILLAVVLGMGIRLVRSASRYEWNYGDSEKQPALKWKILKSIVWIVGVGIIAALINILFV